MTASSRGLTTATTSGWRAVAGAGCRGRDAVGVLRMSKPALRSANIECHVGLDPADTREETPSAVPPERVARDGIGVGKGVYEGGLGLA